MQWHIPAMTLLDKRSDTDAAAAAAAAATGAGAALLALGVPSGCRLPRTVM
jgi:hypothetical protein